MIKGRSCIKTFLVARKLDWFHVETSGLVKIRSVRWWRASAEKVTRSISLGSSFPLCKKRKERKREREKKEEKERKKKRQRKEKYSEKTYSSGPFVVLDIHRESNSLSPRLLPLDETRREREYERTWVKGSGKGVERAGRERETFNWIVGCHDCRDVRAYQLENQLDIGDYDVRALLIRPLETERR